MKKIFLKTSAALLFASMLITGCNSVNRTSSGSDTTDRMDTPNDTSMYNQGDTSGNSTGQTDTMSTPADTSRLY